MSNTIAIITLVINAIDLLIVIMQVCLTWARSARFDDNDQARRMNKAAREMHSHTEQATHPATVDVMAPGYYYPTAIET
ncbi:hypothetical protein Q7P35_011694 [Cladosporium inversicolor]